jgi:glutaredoxin 3
MLFKGDGGKPIPHRGERTLSGLIVFLHGNDAIDDKLAGSHITPPEPEFVPSTAGEKIESVPITSPEGLQNLAISLLVIGSAFVYLFGNPFTVCFRAVKTTPTLRHNVPARGVGAQGVVRPKTPSSIVDDWVYGNPVVVISKSYCPYCKEAVEILEKLDATPLVVQIDERPDCDGIQSYLDKLTGDRNVPSIFIGQQIVGGLDELEALNSDGQLESLLSNATNRS